MRSLVIVLDGVGYDQLADLQPPVLTSLGLRLGLERVRTLLSFSSGIYCSIWSGLYPEEHGVWMEYYRGRDDRFRIGSLFRPVPGKFLPRALTYVVTSGLSRLGWKGSEPFAVPARLQSSFRRIGSDYRLFPPVPIVPTPDFALRLDRSGRRWRYAYCDPMNDRSESLLGELAEHTETLIACFPELDHAGHRFGPDGEEFRSGFSEVDRRIGRLIRSLRAKEGDFSTFVFSDHGMTRVVRSFDFWTYLEQAGFRLGVDYLAFIHSTIVPLWFDRGHRREIIDRLDRSGAGHVLTESELAEYRIRLPKEKFGEDFFLADEGVECVPNFINLARSRGRGMHGYSPRASSTCAFFIGGNQLKAKPRDIPGIHAALEEIMLDRNHPSKPLPKG